MPNHIKNRLEIKGNSKQVKELIKKISTDYPSEPNKAYDGTLVYKTKGEDYKIGWFNEETGMFKRRDMEDVKGIPSGFEQDFADEWTRFPDFEKIIAPPETPDYHATADIHMQNNPNNWYNWNRENWHTKWNAYSCKKESDNIFTFETAWSGVPELIKRMMLSFPDIELIYEWSDEDTGQNCGKKVRFSDGSWITYDIESGSKEAYDLAFKLRPEHKEYYKLVGDNYEGIEEEEE